MAEIINTIRISADSFSDLKTYLDRNPEYLLFSSPLGTSLKVDLKQQKDEKDSAENIVVRWMNDIKGKQSALLIIRVQRKC